MGQAKARGSQAERVAQAKALIEAYRPASITCNHCKANITDVQAIDARSLDGIKAAYAGTCPACGHSTFAFQGDPDSVAKAMVALEAAMEEGAKFGSESGQSEKASNTTPRSH